MRWYSKLAAAALAALLQACATAPVVAPAPAVQAEVRAPVTILISIDGFRPDYLDRGITPVLSGLAAEGVSGPMRPSFPTKTFPNHYAMVTGLRPDRNGIVANSMEDVRRPGVRFTMSNVDSFWWDEAEPIWVAAENAGIRAGTMFWPGSNARIRGVYPSDWQQFSMEVNNRQRVDAVVDWLRRPAAARPRFLTLYFDTVDTAGHDFGPDSPENNAAVAEADRHIGRLREELAILGQPANLVIVADHGMGPSPESQAIRLDRIADPADFRLVEDGPYASFHAVPGREAALEAAVLRPHDHMTCWRKADIPARLHYGRNPRVPPYLCLAGSGWTILGKDPAWSWNPGSHGWDNRDPLMLALFVAHGPAFARGVTVPVFDNVEIYPLLRRLIGLPPATGVDGDGSVFAGALAD